MTTEELLPVLGEIDLEASLQQPLKQLLRTAEPIKFAGQSATREQMLSDLAFGRELVEKTIPAEQEEDV